MSLRIKKNDRVQVITGRDKGTVARVLYVIPDKDKAVVENVNMVKRHQRQRSQKGQGGIITKEAPIHVSNLLLYCEKCKRGVRFGVEITEGGKEKQRVCRLCGVVL
jgi:large subunit ribosomal protein L24